MIRNKTYPTRPKASSQQARVLIFQQYLQMYFYWSYILIFCVKAFLERTAVANTDEVLTWVLTDISTTRVEVVIRVKISWIIRIHKSFTWLRIKTTDLLSRTHNLDLFLFKEPTVLVCFRSTCTVLKQLSCSNSLERVPDSRISRRNPNSTQAKGVTFPILWAVNQGHLWVASN